MSKRKRPGDPEDEEEYIPTSKNHALVSITERRATRLMTTDASRRAVFETPELLEQVLLHPSPLQIMRANRICNHFRNVIQGSTQLQLQIFKTAKPAREHWVRKNVGTKEAFHLATGEEANRFVVAKQNPFFFMQPTTSRLASDSWDTARAVVKWEGQKLWFTRSMLPLLNEYINGKGRKDESWRSMLLVDAPIQQITIRSHIHFAKGGVLKMSRAVQTDGSMTLGAFLQQAFNPGDVEDDKYVQWQLHNGRRVVHQKPQR